MQAIRRSFLPFPDDRKNLIRSLVYCVCWKYLCCRILSCGIRYRQLSFLLRIYGKYFSTMSCVMAFWPFLINCDAYLPLWSCRLQRPFFITSVHGFLEMPLTVVVSSFVPAIVLGIARFFMRFSARTPSKSTDIMSCKTE